MWLCSRHLFLRSDEDREIFPFFILVFRQRSSLKWPENTSVDAHFWMLTAVNVGTDLLTVSWLSYRYIKPSIWIANSGKKAKRTTETLPKRNYSSSMVDVLLIIIHIHSKFIIFVMSLIIRPHQWALLMLVSKCMLAQHKLYISITAESRRSARFKAHTSYTHTFCYPSFQCQHDSLI